MKKLIEEAIKQNIEHHYSGYETDSSTLREALKRRRFKVLEEGAQIAIDILAGSEDDVAKSLHEFRIKKSYKRGGTRITNMSAISTEEFAQYYAAQAVAKALKGSVTKIELRVRDLEKTCQEHLVHGTLHEDEFQSKKSEYLFLKSLLPQPPKTN